MADDGGDQRLLPEGSLVLLVGPPAAGKSTLAADLIEAGEVAADDVLSSDTLRELLTGDAADTRHERKVFSRLRQELEARMAAGATTVVDATNLWPRRRGTHIRVAKEHHRPVVAIRFHVPTEELVRRNAARDRQVPTGAVVTMARQLSDQVAAATLLEEGVDHVLDAAAVAHRLGHAQSHPPARVPGGGSGNRDPMPSEHTVADNIIYDLVSVQYHALKGAEVNDRYIEDAHDHQDVVAFFQRVKEEDERRAQEAHDLLRKLTKERDGIG